MNKTCQQGYTFIELMVVMALVGIIVAFGIVMNVSSIGRSSVLSERDLFVTLLLRGARAEAMANADQKSHGIHIDSANRQYILFEDSSYVSEAPTNRIVPFTDTGMNVSNTGGTDVIFRQISGDVTTGAGTITLTKGANSVQIVINSAGQIDW